MPRIADALERESRTVDLEQGDFERLLGRRERKQRNRRIRAGALGVIVALAMGIVLVRSLTSDRIPADPPVEPRPAPAASGTLAYELDGDIYVADPDGSNAVKIANGLPDGEDCADHPDGGPYWAEGPMWSPDGRYLAYRYEDCSNPESGGRRDQRRGGQRARDVPRARDGRSRGRRIPHASRCGTSRSRRSASTGSTALGRRSSRCRPDGPRPATTTRSGCRTVPRCGLRTGSCRSTAARRGSFRRSGATRTPPTRPTDRSSRTAPADH